MGSPITIRRLVFALSLIAILPTASLIAKSQDYIDSSRKCHHLPATAIQHSSLEGSLSWLEGDDSVNDKIYGTQSAEVYEQYFQLGCLVSGFSGYFNPARWLTCAASGDSGVDVTGAPMPRLLVEGTDNDLIEVVRQGCDDFTIIIPADGYVSFKWEQLGSSLSQHPTATDFFTFAINGEAQRLPAADLTYTAPFLRKGDQLSFSIAEHALSSTIIRNFEFMSNAMGVIERAVYASGQAPDRQLIPIENTSISDVIIPAEIRLQLSDYTELERLAQPYLVGQPYIDRDGEASTTTDQVKLLEIETSLDLSWEDQTTYDDTGELIIVRTWHIYDHCAGNEIHQEQWIYCRPKWSGDE